MKTIALYMRLSNEDAHEGESYSIGNQRALLMDYVKSHEEFENWSVLEFYDDGYSGVSFERPGIQKLLALAGDTVNCIIVKDDCVILELNSESPENTGLCDVSSVF